MKTLILQIEYDGTNYAGWQIQPNDTTIQGLIENALISIYGFDIGVIAAGRTDAGVHARGQVAHTKLLEDFPVPQEKIPVALNSKLPNDIRIKKAILLPNNFHARYDAAAREYSYTIITKESVFNNRFTTYFKYQFDSNILIKSAEIFLGKHDFTTFSKLNEDTKNYVCNVETCFWQKTDENKWKLTIKADHFVYGMVRAIVGALLDCARGKRTLNDIKSALKKCDRNLASPLAPPQGLILEKVYYPEKFNFFV